MNKHLSIITLNVNGLNVPIKRHGIHEWIRNHEAHMCCLQEIHSEQKTESEGLETNIPNKWTGK